jgi:hypothetical protein
LPCSIWHVNRAADSPLDARDDPDLLDELGNVRLVERSPGVVRMDHVEGQHDDRAIALALAASKLIERSPGTGAAVCEGESILPEGPLAERGVPVLSYSMPF